ncbi:C-type mannose receptor 2-like [Ptychodera flava]|uniref:C-type mannose receptor 2-like n=1 Tax=Ptychodera flava TaxID=63121 RepID=UPI00396A2379
MLPSNKVIYTHLLVIVLQCFFQPVKTSDCPNEFDNHCYEISSSHLSSSSWRKALTDCHGSLSGKGHLADIRNDAENDYIVHNVIGNSPVWIGIHDSVTEGRYQTVMNDDAPYLNFMSGQPDDGSTSLSEDCVVMDVTGEWYDEYCYRQYPALCKRRKDGVTCDELHSPLYGRISNRRPETFPANVGDTVTFDCNPGYVIDGPQTITCDEGFWNRLPPICEVCDNPYNGYCYEVVEEDGLSATSYCRNVYLGYSVDITDANENSHVMNLLNLFSSDVDKVLLGITDNTEEGTFRTVWGIPTSYADWYDGEPADDVAVIKISNGKWMTVDNFNFDRLGSVCKRKESGECGAVEIPGAVITNDPVPIFPVASGYVLSFTCTEFGHILHDATPMTCTVGYWDKSPSYCEEVLRQMVYDDSTYTFVDIRKNWDEADTYCQTMNSGRLVTIADSHESATIQAFADDFFDILDYRVWIGITDQQTEGVYMTVENELAHYLPWNSGWSGDEPNGGVSDNCVAMSRSSGHFYDYDCLESFSFVCKTIEPSTPPTTMSARPPSTSATTSMPSSQTAATLGPNTTVSPFQAHSTTRQLHPLIVTSQSQTTTRSFDTPSMPNVPFATDSPNVTLTRMTVFKSGLFWLEAEGMLASGPPICTTNVPSIITCAHACLSQALCVSFNIQRGPEDESRQCELFSEVYQVSQLREHSDFSYFRS